MKTSESSFCLRMSSRYPPQFKGIGLPWLLFPIGCENENAWFVSDQGKVQSKSKTSLRSLTWEYGAYRSAQGV